MNRYQNGQIYKIVDVGYNKCFLGSTTETLSQRMARHRRCYKKYLNGTYGRMTSFALFKEFGVENCKIVWIEDYPCNSKKELEAREGEHQQKTHCVNKRMEGRTMKQWTEDNKEYLQNYRKNKYERTKEELLRTNKLKIPCDICGSIVRKVDLSRHKKSAKCQSCISNNS